MEDYIVQYGDTLSVIAAKQLGDKNRWREIARLNNLQNTNQLFVGQRLRLPRVDVTVPSTIAPPQNLSIPDTSKQQVPASLALARGCMFVVFEQLPEVGSKNVVRKVLVTPKDFSLFPPNPLANLTPAKHALGNNNSQFLSTSNKPFGSPSKSNYLIEPDGWKDVLLIDTSKVQAMGTRIITVDELVAELRRHALENPASLNRVNTLIKAIQNVEGETLIEGGVPGDAVKKVSTVHRMFIETADEIVRSYKAGVITEVEMNIKLANLAKAYEKARIVGKFGRVLTVVGVVFTAVDVANAAQKSYSQRSYKPLAAESVRQIGGWSGAYAGSIIGAETGFWFGIEAGPWAIVTGAIGAIAFGAVGYWRGDVLAGWIEDKEMATQLRKDVRATDNFINKGITLTVGADETQYMFCRRALMRAASQGGLLIDSRQREYADKFYSLRADPGKAANFEATWEGKDPTPNDGKNVKPAEFDQYRGKQLTYFLNKQEVDELIKLVFQGY